MMMPIVLTNPSEALVVGGGRAGVIKVRTLLNYVSKVDVVTLGVCEEMQKLASDHPETIQIRTGDFYQLNVEELSQYPLIYFTFPWPSELEEKKYVEGICRQLLAQNKLLCVSNRPELGNIINPCSRSTEKTLISVSTYGKDPKRSVVLADELLDAVIKHELLEE